MTVKSTAARPYDCDEVCGMPDTSPRPDGPPTSSDPGRERTVLVRTWAYRLVSVCYTGRSQRELEPQLLGLFDAVCAAVRAEPPEPGPAREAGGRLVTLGCVGEDALSATIEVLGRGLLSQREFQPVERFANRIVRGLGAIAAGFAEASRKTVFEQQETMNLALLKAVRDAKWHLRQSEARFDKVAMSSTSGIIITDLRGLMVRANAAFSEMLGYSATELTGITLFDIVPDDYARVLREDYQQLLTGAKERVKQSQRLRCKNGDIARVSLTASLLRGADDQPGHFVTVVEDGTELSLLRNELSRQSLHDALTGLPNRQLFSTQVDGALRRADPEFGVTLLHLGLDAFAVLRAGLGRHVGEYLLIEAKRRLVAVFAGEKATIARLDGDEFGILLENSASTPNVAATVARINAELAKPVPGEGRDAAMSASVGVVHRPAGQWDAAELLRVAELALRRAAAAGPAQWALFDPDEDASTRQDCALAVAMPSALARGDIGAVYRPLADLGTGRLVGLEALLRWQPAGRPVLAHQRCAALAERTGLTQALGEWLLQRACQDTNWWSQRHGAALSVAVPLTVFQSSDVDLVSRVVSVLNNTDLPPDRLTLWLPAPTVATPEIADNFRVLAELGIRAGLHDFGASAEELALVEDLPVRSVRIANRLVRRQARADADTSFVRALAAVGPLVRRAGASVVVDGVHTPAQADWWRSAGADTGLGDLFGPAGPPEDVIGRAGADG